MCDVCEKYGDRRNVMFDCVNILSTLNAVPKVDLILARQVLIHFPNEHAAAVLDKFRASGSRYLLTSHWPAITENTEYEPEGFAWRGYQERPLNMEREPFNLPPSLDALVEPPGPSGVLRDAHELALFDLQQTVVVAGGPCEHKSTYRVHTAGGTVNRICSDCRQLVDIEAAEEGEQFSFAGTLARWHREITGAGTEEPVAEETKRKLVLVDKAKLRQIRDNHRQAVEMAREDDSLAAAWLLLGVQAAAIDTILTEMSAGDD
jgi:hypothetical protein